MRRVLRVLGSAVLAALAGGSGLLAQVAPEGRGHAEPPIEASFAYSLVRSNAGPGNCGCFFMNGGSSEVAFHAYRDVSAVVDVTGEHAGAINSTGEELSLLTFTAGPRISYPIRGPYFTRYIPFAQALLGTAHGFGSSFPDSAGTVKPSANSLAFLVGGGLDARMTRRLDFRIFQVDYGYTALPNNAGNQENLLRVSTGIVLRFRQRR